jgi:hypothetical protein
VLQNNLKQQSKDKYVLCICSSLFLSPPDKITVRGLLASVIDGPYFVFIDMLPLQKLSRLFDKYRPFPRFSEDK